MGKARGVFFSLCIGFIIGFFWGGSIAAANNGLLTFEVYIIEIRYGLIFAAFFGLIAAAGGAIAGDGDKVERKLDQIENKLDMFFSETECSNCKNMLQYPSNFTGQMQCKKCSSITSVNQ